MACLKMGVAGRPAASDAEMGLIVGAVYAAKFRVLERLRRDLHGLSEIALSLFRIIPAP